MSNQSKGISVIICCYNSENKITPTLQHLAMQQAFEGFVYEIILVDNNCTDNTVHVVTEYWNNVKSPFPLTIIKQSQAGLTYARQKGIDTATYDYVILCDDDNWLCNDYLKKMIILLEKLPAAALIGGVGEPVFENNPPAWFRQVNGFGYAVGTDARETGFVDSVYGAGMGIRKPVFQNLMKEGVLFILSDRKGRSLSSGGDTEICMIVKNAGYKIYLDTSLTFKHFLNSDRLQWNYYLNLRRSFGKANAYLQLYNNGASKIVRKSSRVKQLLSFSKYLIGNWKYAFFPNSF